MKRDIKKNIILIITYIALIIYVLVNYEKILSILGYIINIFTHLAMKSQKKKL